MPSPINAELSQALAKRLNMQISLSILPVVEEWMDADMSRWLESVPMPPELPGDERASFLVSVGSDRRRLRWGAHGHPSGFVPRMAEYLTKCGVKPEEVELINEVGQELEPEKVGTWVKVAPGQLTTGWHFLDERPIAQLGKLLHAGEAGVRLLEWAAAVGVDRFSRFSRAIGEEAMLEVALPVTGTDLEDRLATAASAFAAFGVGELPQAAREAGRESETEDLILVVAMTGDAVARAGLMVGGLSRDAVASAAKRLGMSLDPEIERLQGALGSSGPDWLEISSAGGEVALDLHVVPGADGGADPAAPS